jgi:hypothetical protein
MIVYNTTYKVDLRIVEDWLSWQQKEHIPDIMATHLFDGHKIYRLLELEEEDGLTFTIQFFAPNIEAYQQYISTHAPLLRKKAFDKWGHQVVSFGSLMQAVQ